MERREELSKRLKESRNLDLTDLMALELMLFDTFTTFQAVSTDSPSLASIASPIALNTKILAKHTSLADLKEIDI
jgi:hypothetical protein